MSSNKESAALLDLCVACYTSFDGTSRARRTPATQFDHFVASCKDEKARSALLADEATAEFVRDIFYTMLRYNALILRLVESFLDTHKSVVTRADKNRFLVLVTVTLWRLGDLGFEQYKNLLAAEPGHKTAPFLHAFFDEDSLQTWFRAEASTCFDVHHIDSVLIPQLTVFAPSALALRNSLAAADAHRTRLAVGAAADATAAAANGGAQGRALSPSRTTVPVPFTLSESNSTRKLAPHAVPREAAPAPFHARPVPAALAETSLEDIERGRQEAWRQIAATTALKYTDVESHVPTHADARLAAAAAARAAKDADAAASAAAAAADTAAAEESATRRLKDLGAHPADKVRLNAAALLREEAVYRRQQEEKLQQLQRFASELKDSTEYDAWKARAQADADAARAAEVQQRKEAAARAVADAQEAVRRRVAEVQEQAQQQRTEARDTEVTRLREAAAEAAAKRTRAEGIIAERANAAAAVGRAAEERAATAEDLRREREANRRRVEQERAAELVLKKDLIKQIQAMEQVAHARARAPKEVDPTATAGHGLLGEMSLAELRAKLVTVKTEAEAEAADRRARAADGKMLRQAKLEAMARNHAAIRAYNKEQGDERRAGKALTEDAKAAVEAARAAAAAVAADRLAVERAASQREAALLLAQQSKVRTDEVNFRLAAKAAQLRQRAEELKASAVRRAQKDESDALAREEQSRDEAQRRARAAARSHKEQALAQARGIALMKHDLEARHSEAQKQAALELARRRKAAVSVRASRSPRAGGSTGDWSESASGAVTPSYAGRLPSQQGSRPGSRPLSAVGAAGGLLPATPLAARAGAGAGAGSSSVMVSAGAASLASLAETKLSMARTARATDAAPLAYGAGAF